MKNIAHQIILIFFLMFSLQAKQKHPQPCVNGKYFVESKYVRGRLGNQLFQIAAALSVAIDNNAEAIFPDYQKQRDSGIPVNRKLVFPRINKSKPNDKIHFFFKEHHNHKFKPIPFHPNMQITGYFQSEKYFAHNKEEVISYFLPSEQINNYLEKNYHDILSHENSVAVHFRSYKDEDRSLSKMFVTLGINYIEEAAKEYDDDALFIIFSDNLTIARENLKGFSRPHIFLHEKNYIYSFYLMSKLKHQIIANSTFSWWAAYLNPNPDKIIAAPHPWFHPKHFLTSEHIVPKSWIKIPVTSMH